jgi:hypothetical protein
MLSEGLARIKSIMTLVAGEEILTELFNISIPMSFI